MIGFVALFFFALSLVYTQEIPPEWTCDPDAYDDDEVCNCECGAPDPDCLHEYPLEGCPGSAIGCDEESKCTFPIDPPDDWACDASLWNDGEGCDCECGTFDPDCFFELPIHFCASHVDYCLWEDGSCHYDYPESWDCGRYTYNDTEVCDCNCGAGDPDCLNPDLPIVGCGLHAIGCTITGHCLFPDQPPDEWIDDCEDDWYGQDNWCDCNCGAYDPDCEDQTKKLYGCSSYPGTTWCSYEGHCIEDPYRLWNCDLSLYDDGVVCNCGCGKYDPDCDIEGAEITGCPPSAVGCNPDGTCRYPTSEGWECPMENYDSNDGCHCNCGAFDPDCDGDIETSDIFGCSEGYIGCDGNGFCVYESEYYDGTADVVLIALMIAIIPPFLVIALVCCCIIFVFVGPACVNIAIIFICREAKKRKLRGLNGEEEMVENPYSGLEEDLDDLDAVGGDVGGGGGGGDFETVEDITGRNDDFGNQDFDDFGGKRDNISGDVEEDNTTGGDVVRKKELFRKKKNDEF